MSDPNKKSFFSGLGGVVTGLAGLLSAGAAVTGLAVSQGWIGDGSKSSPNTGANAVRPGASPATDSGTQFSVDPTRLMFESLGPRQLRVTVRNTGEAALDVDDPSVTGPNASMFDAAPGTCSNAVGPGRSCDLTVTFTPRTGSFTATLVVEAEGAQRAAEVLIRAQGLL